MDQLNKYARGKIYAIICLFTGEVYLGSTTMESIKDRITIHKALRQTYLKWVANGKPGGKVSNISSFPLIARGMWTYFCVEEYPCTSKKDLHAREGHHIRLYKKRYGALCVNRYIPGRTNAEWVKANPESIKRSNDKQYAKNAQSYRDYSAQYRKDHPEYKQTIAEWRKRNPDYSKNYAKKRRAENPEHVKKIQKESRERNKEQTKERMKVRVVCKYCQTSIRHCSKARHERTEKCKTSRSALATSFTA
jgi:hypothetical protein